MNTLVVSASCEGQVRTEVLEHVPSLVLNGRQLMCPDGRVIAERVLDNWQSRRGRHARIVILGEVKMRFEAPAYQFDSDQQLQEVELVGGTLWSCARELIAFYDAATGRWRDADNQQWSAIRLGATVEANRSARLPSVELSHPLAPSLRAG